MSEQCRSCPRMVEAVITRSVIRIHAMLMSIHQERSVRRRDSIMVSRGMNVRMVVGAPKLMTMTKLA